VDCIGLVIGKEPDVESMKGEPDVYFSPCVEPTVACTAACTEQDEEPMEVIVEEVCTHNVRRFVKVFSISYLRGPDNVR